MEKPILFNSEMINAILNGEKTMTRRIIKTQPVNPKWSGSEWIEAGCDDTKHFVLKCPFGKVGDCLWVRENWCVHQRYDIIPPRSLPETKSLQNGITYLADVYKSEKSLWMGRTRPSIFMPRWASRINLEIIDVRVEKLQNISEDDALAEGIERSTWMYSCEPYRNYNYPKMAPGKNCSTAIMSFCTLWDSINKKRGYGWAKNPFCWCVSFRKVGT